MMQLQCLLKVRDNKLETYNLFSIPEVNDGAVLIPLQNFDSEKDESAHRNESPVHCTIFESLP